MFFLYKTVISRKKPNKTPGGRNMFRTGLKNKCCYSTCCLEIYNF